MRDTIRNIPFHTAFTYLLFEGWELETGKAKSTKVYKNKLNGKEIQFEFENETLVKWYLRLPPGFEPIEIKIPNTVGDFIDSCMKHNINITFKQYKSDD